MNAPDRPRHKLLTGKRISTIHLANPLEPHHFPQRDWQTLLIRFTDGTTAEIDARAAGREEAFLEVAVDGY